MHELIARYALQKHQWSLAAALEYELRYVLRWFQRH